MAKYCSMAQLRRFAIRVVEREIDDMRKRGEGKGPDVEAFVNDYISERTTKLEELKEKYRIETGTEYI